ncbi:hypothetical protein [Stenotrophomonas sp. GZD-301]|uniref:hypothetical protein n=1 Tax=Stenotrophomonas sp. GZD-301 TaxID=3404814 RepID=UPI003BB5D374
MTTAPRPARTARAPWLGLASFLGLPLGGAAGYAAAHLGSAAATGGGTTGAAIGVLAAAVIGLMATVGARVRQERWPWLGIVGAVVSAAPLAVFIVGMMVMR